MDGMRNRPPRRCPATGSKIVSGGRNEVNAPRCHSKTDWVGLLSTGDNLNLPRLCRGTDLESDSAVSPLQDPFHWRARKQHLGRTLRFTECAPDDSYDCALVLLPPGRGAAYQIRIRDPCLCVGVRSLPMLGDDQHA